MPFKSEKQRAWMHANKPDMAKQWEKETPEGTVLPERAPKRPAPMPRRPQAKRPKRRAARGHPFDQ